MAAEFKHTLRRLRGQISGWSIGLTLYSVMMVSLYGSIQEIEGLTEMLQSYPPELLAFFGNLTAITTAQGYMDVYYFSYMTVIIGIFVVSTGASLIVGDEEKGTLDLILSQPVSRTRLFLGRYLGLVMAVTLILLIGWLTWVLPPGSRDMGLTWVEFLRPFLPLWAELLLFGTLALFLSLVMPASRAAGMTAGGLLVANFLLVGLANINQDLQRAVEFTPLHYYQGGSAIDGLNWGWLAGLLAGSLVLMLLAWWRFQRRDIRLGGERTWKLPALSSLLRRRSTSGQQAQGQARS
ncbi:MAG: ABC transporter permease subunit [Anaerolineae bacterium]